MKKFLLAMLVITMMAGCSNTDKLEEAKGATIEVSSETVEIPLNSQQVEWKEKVYEVVTVTSADGTEIEDSKLFLKGAVDTSVAGEVPLTLVITENGIRTEKEITLIVK